MQRTRDRLEVLADAAAALAGELELETILQSITTVSAQVTGARYAALGVVGPDDTITRFVTHGADDETIRAIGHYPTGRGLLGLLIRDPRIIRLDDIAAHPASSGFPPHHPPMTTFLGAPVRSRGRVYGNLYLTEKDGGFDDDDERLIAVLAAQAGAAIDNALLAEQLRSLAVADERERISRELHDGVIQTLFSIGMGLESARTLLRTDPDRVDERLDSAVEALDGSIRELRNYIFQLRPHEAGTMGFGRGLAELAREYEVNALVRPELDVPSDIDARVPAGIVPDLLQIVREALSNCAKHAAASEVRITARRGPQGTELTVSDDGVGFTVGTHRVGRGLDNIRERAQALTAKLEIDSAPGKGTRISILVPLDDGVHA